MASDEKIDRSAGELNYILALIAGASGTLLSSADGQRVTVTAAIFLLLGLIISGTSCARKRSEEASNHNRRVADIGIKFGLAIAGAGVWAFVSSLIGQFLIIYIIALIALSSVACIFVFIFAKRK